MNWKIAAIVIVGISLLICISAAVYVGLEIFHSLPIAQARTDCNSNNFDVSIRGCSAILQSSSATDADRTYAHFQRGLSYERKGDMDHAIQDDSEVIKVSPKEAMAYNNRGFAYQRKGDLDHAIADYDHAIQLVPELGIAWFNRGVAYNLKGDYTSAIEDFNRVVKLEPKNPMAWNNRCYYRAIVGQLDDALADCNKSLQLQPGVGATLDSRAFTYLKMKKYDLALADYDAAIKGNEGHAGSGAHAAWLYGRGLARRAKHDLTGSESDIAAAKRIDPGIVEQFRKYGVS